MTRGTIIGSHGERLPPQRSLEVNRTFSGRGGLSSFYSRKEKRKNKG